MGMFAGLDVGGKQTAVCVVDEVAKIVFRGIVDTHPEMRKAKRLFTVVSSTLAAS